MRIYTTDELGYCSDYEVQRTYDEIEYKLKILRKKRDFSSNYRRELEIESCYVYRELEKRNSRVAAHKKYLSSLS